MADVIWGLGTSHVPAIGAAMDRGKTEDEYWKPLFDAYAPARAWMSRHQPDVVVVVYNDHANALSPDAVSTFAVAAASGYEVADEGWGPRPVPPFAGHPELSEHLIAQLVEDEFDVTTLHRLEVDHGLTVPMSIFCPDPAGTWPCTVVPVLVNVLEFPQPTPKRCLHFGEALGRAIRSFPEALKVAVIGTGGMSHQLAGARAGMINQAFDSAFLEAIGTDPGSLAGLSRGDFIREAGTEGLELIMWLVMRGALGESVTRVCDAYHVPVSNTAAGLALFASS